MKHRFLIALLFIPLMLVLISAIAVSAPFAGISSKPVRIGPAVQEAYPPPDEDGPLPTEAAYPPPPPPPVEPTLVIVPTKPVTPEPTWTQCDENGAPVCSTCACP